MKKEDEYIFYVQLRDMHAKRAPGMIGMWGGGREGNESSEENLFREMKEELNYVPQQHKFFTKYESSYGTFDLYMEEVDATFEASITILEGQAGLWMTSEEVFKSEKTTALTKLIISQVAEYLVNIDTVK